MYDPPLQGAAALLLHVGIGVLYLGRPLGSSPRWRDALRCNVIGGGFSSAKPLDEVTFKKITTVGQITYTLWNQFLYLLYFQVRGCQSR